MFLAVVVLFFGLSFLEFKAVSSVYALIAYQTSGVFAFLMIGCSFFLMAFIGLSLIRSESQKLLKGLKQSSQTGAIPKPNILLFLAGALFVVPGYVTDLFALLLIFPPSAWLIRKAFANKLKNFSEKGPIRFYSAFGGAGRPGYGRVADPDRLGSDPTIIDVEVSRP